MADGGFDITGSKDLAQAARALKDAGDGELRKELMRRVRDAAKAAVPDIREAARSKLPKSGGLADRVASQAYAVRASYAASGATVRVTGSGMKGLRAIDAGQVRHPVFGRDDWVSQQVEPGFFSETLDGHAPKVRQEIENAVDDIRHRIDRSV